MDAHPAIERNVLGHVADPGSRRQRIVHDVEAGNAGGSGATLTNVADYAVVKNGPVFPQFSRDVLGTLCLVKDVDARLASDLSLAVIRLARQLRFRRLDSPVSLSQLSALSTLAPVPERVLWKGLVTCIASLEL